MSAAPVVTTYPATGTTTVPAQPGATCECCYREAIPAVCTVTSEVYPVDVCQSCFDITEAELVQALAHHACNTAPRRRLGVLHLPTWRRKRGA